MSFLGSAFKIIDPSQLFHLQVPNFGKLTREGIDRGDESSKVKYVTRNCYCRRCVRTSRRRCSSDRTRRGARSRTKSGSHRLRSSMGGSGGRRRERRSRAFSGGSGSRRSRSIVVVEKSSDRSEALTCIGDGVLKLVVVSTKESIQVEFRG